MTKKNHHSFKRIKIIIIKGIYRFHTVLIVQHSVMWFFFVGPVQLERKTQRVKNVNHCGKKCNSHKLSNSQAFPTYWLIQINGCVSFVGLVRCLLERMQFEFFFHSFLINYVYFFTPLKMRSIVSLRRSLSRSLASKQNHSSSIDDLIEYIRNVEMPGTFLSVTLDC